MARVMFDNLQNTNPVGDDVVVSLANLIANASSMKSATLFMSNVRLRETMQTFPRQPANKLTKLSLNNSVVRREGMYKLANCLQSEETHNSFKVSWPRGQCFDAPHEGWQRLLSALGNRNCKLEELGIPYKTGLEMKVYICAYWGMHLQITQHSKFSVL